MDHGECTTLFRTNVHAAKKNDLAALLTGTTGATSAASLPSMKPIAPMSDMFNVEELRVENHDTRIRTLLSPPNYDGIFTGKVYPGWGVDRFRRHR